MKEHMVVYLSSGKSHHASQVFSKQGGKGNRNSLEQILKNSENVCKFISPEKSTLFFTFDNIQTLLKSHRIGGEQQSKILVIVVCSILCLQPDGEQKQSEIQYTCENAPATWLYQYKYDLQKKIIGQNISAAHLKDCIAISDSDRDIFEKIFEEDIKTALDFVKNDMNDNFEDSVDITAKAEISKKRKLCENGHINDNVKGNRKICDRETCKANLSIVRKLEEVAETAKVDIDRNVERANLYMNVPNVFTDDVPKESAVGAIAVNPNTTDRIQKVLDEILDAAGMKNTYAVKIVITANSVIKVYNSNPDFRKHIVVTADGLPYKVMIELIKNVHTCVVCGKKLVHITDLSEHMKQTQHSEYFQTYGNILPNIGYFHYSLTMLRSLVKLEWDIDYEHLVKSIHFETPKALFTQHKVTDYRKSMDTRRTVRQAKMREFVTPYVKHALETKQNINDINVESFLRWKTCFVKSETYKAVFEIEKIFGTSFLLFHSALRANNFKLASIAKRLFSPLLHVNRHPNYSIMDIHTDYVHQAMTANAPELKTYLDTRQTSNFTRKDYAGEPHDERHEEYNKRGLNMQRVKTVNDFKQSF